MGHTSRCPGCKLPKSEHRFGKPEPHCTGTFSLHEDQENEQDDCTETFSLHKDQENEQDDGSNEGVSPLAGSMDNTLLTESIKPLSEEVKAIRIETKELCSMVTKPPSKSPTRDQLASVEPTSHKRTSASSDSSDTESSSLLRTRANLPVPKRVS